MRNTLLALSVLGAIAATGCGAHQSTQWKVRDQYGWPMQTWETNPNLQVAVYREPRCAQFAHLGVVNLRFGRALACCDQPVSTNSWGDKAAACGGRKNWGPVGHIVGGKVVYVDDWYKPVGHPVTAPVSAASTVTPAATRTFVATHR